MLAKKNKKLSQLSNNSQSSSNQVQSQDNPIKIQIFRDSIAEEEWQSPFKRIKDIHAASATLPQQKNISQFTLKLIKNQQQIENCNNQTVYINNQPNSTSILNKRKVKCLKNINIINQDQKIICLNNIKQDYLNIQREQTMSEKNQKLDEENIYQQNQLEIKEKQQFQDNYILAKQIQNFQIEQFIKFEKRVNEYLNFEKIFLIQGQNIEDELDQIRKTQFRKLQNQKNYLTLKVSQNLLLKKRFTQDRNSRQISLDYQLKNNTIN